MCFLTIHPLAPRFHIRWIVLALTTALLLQGLHAEDPENVFKTPPIAAKPYVYWFWMGRNITADGITGDLAALKDEGIGGTVMCNLSDSCTPWNYEIGHGLNPEMVPYVSNSWWELVKHAATESAKLGLDFGIGDCAGYETSGGPWITPELSMQEMCFSKIEVLDSRNVSICLPKPEVDPHSDMVWPLYNPETGQLGKPIIEARKTYYEDIAVLAVPESEIIIPIDHIIDLTNKMTADGRLNWNAPPGSWIIYRFGHTTVGALNNPAIWKATGLECDKMNPKAVSFYMDHLLGEMKKNLGPLLGHGLNYIWIDSYEYGAPLSSWTPDMKQEFMRRRGYDLTPYLLVRAGQVIKSKADSEKFDRDYLRTMQDLYRDVHFAITAQKAHEAGLQFRTEPYFGPWDIKEIAPKVNQLAAEFWNRHNSYGPVCVDAVVAAAHAANQNIVNSEAFTAMPDVSQWSETPANLKSIGDNAFCDGINRFIIHRFVHQPWNDLYKPGIAMGQWGTHFDRNQTWWVPGRAWITYLTRCQALLQWGKPVEPLSGDFSNDVLRSYHRSDGSQHVYFVANLTHQPVNATCHFAVGGLQPELWNPVTGKLQELDDFHAGRMQTDIPLQFEPSQSWFVVFRHPLQKTVHLSNFPTLTIVQDFTGPWQVQFDPAWGGPRKPVLFPNLQDWSTNSNPEIRYFSGTATYSKTFSIAKPSPNLCINLGIVNALAQVRLNGVDLGVIWTAPWRVDLPIQSLLPGENRLEIEVTNVWANRLIGDEQEISDCTWLPGHMGFGSYLKEFPEWVIKGTPRPSTNRYCFSSWNYFSKSSPLQPSGLLGPVQLLKKSD